VTDVHEFLEALTVVLVVAALITVRFQYLRQPVVLGYIIAGLIVGPHVPISLVADSGVVQMLSELGVILLMFSLGLEFSLRKLLQVAPTAGLSAVVPSRRNPRSHRGREELAARRQGCHQRRGMFLLYAAALRPPPSPCRPPRRRLPSRRRPTSTCLPAD
jgi:hypothetical protein